MQRYAITDRRLLPGTEAEKHAGLIAQAGRLARAGVDYLQVREKDLGPDQMLALVIAIRDAVAAPGAQTRVVLNGPAELAMAAGVGLHRSSVNRQISREQVVSVACHSLDDIVASRDRAELLLFAPVFEKSAAGERVSAGTGLTKLSEACAAAGATPVFALGGVTAANAAACIAAGAAGIAGIRMFLEHGS